LPPSFSALQEHNIILNSLILCALLCIHYKAYNMIWFNVLFLFTCAGLPVSSFGPCQTHEKLLHIENAMSRPLELAGPPAYTLHRSMLVIIAMNSVLGLCGYLRYGDRCAGSISLNLPQDNRLVPRCVLLF